MSKANPFTYTDCAKCADLEAENARLQERVKKAEAEAIRLSNYETAYNNSCRERAGYKALAEQRGEELDKRFPARMVRRQSRLVCAYCFNENPSECVRAAIDARPEEARQKE